MTNISDKVRILLCGYYFHGNTGDDLLMESIVNTLSRYGEVRVTGSFEPDLIDWCDLLVIGGGSHIRATSIGPHAHAQYAKQKGKKIVYYAQTIEEGHPLFREHLALADLITVRDAESKRVVEKNQFRAVLSSDPIFERKRRTIGFSFRRWTNEPSGIEERLAKVMDDLSVKYNVISLPYTPNDTDTESDIAFHEQIIKRMRYRPVLASFNEGLEKVDLLIAMRLHALINAVNADKRVLAINYDAKVKRIFSDLALEDMMVPYDEIEQIPSIVRDKIFRVNGLAQREKVNEALIEKICADIKGEPPPRVSVVMPTYNRANYIKGAIDSVLAQTIQGWELIIIDDGSSDNTREVVELYKDERIKYYNFGHNGINFSRNIGNLLSGGEIIAVAEPTDLSLPNRLEVSCEELERDKTDIIYSSVLHYGNKGEKKLISGHPFSYERLKEGNFIYHPTVAYRRDVAVSCPYNEDSEITEDYLMYLQAADKGYRFRCIEEPLVKHQLRDEQIFSTKDTETLKEGEKPIHSYRCSTPMVSVIIPTCNRSGFLKEAIESVFSQTYKNFEIVVINDGGKDVSEVIDPLEDSGKIVYLQHEERKGPSATRNTGLKAAKGKYIAYLDDDDVYYPDHLATLVRFLENNDCKVAYTDSYQAFQTWITDRYLTTGKEITYSYDFDRQKFLICNYIHIINIMHRKELLDEVGLFDEGLETHEDWDLCIRLSQQCDFHHIKVVTAEFRTRDDATNATKIKREDFLRTLKLIHERYARLVTDANILEAQKKLEESLAVEVAIRQASSLGVHPAYISNLETIMRKRDDRIRELEASLEEKDAQITNLEYAVREKDAQITNLESTIREKDTHIGNLEYAVREKDTQITNLESTLNHIYNSHGWKVLLAYYRVMDGIFPHDTRRRRMCELGLRGFRVLANEGPASFFTKSKEYLFRKKS